MTDVCYPPATLSNRRTKPETQHLQDLAHLYSRLITGGSRFDPWRAHHSKAQRATRKTFPHFPPRCGVENCTGRFTLPRPGGAMRA
jgi:hypothetical protein